MSNTSNEILEGNKLIAEFMEFTVTEFIWKEYLGLVHCDEDGEFEIDEDLDYYSPNTDWNDLMPVVEKIEGDEVDLNISVVIKKNKCGIYRHKNSPYEIQLFLQESQSKIEAVWLAVVEFIKFYNQNKRTLVEVTFFK